MSDFSSLNDISAAWSAVGNRGVSRRFTIPAYPSSSIIALYPITLWWAAGGAATSVTWTVMDDTVAGALIPNIVNGGTKTNRVLELEAKAASGQHRLVIVDRLASMYFDQTTQGIPYALNADLVALSAAGRCDPGGADVQWWMESIGTYGILNITVYTLNVTYNDGSTGQIVFSPPVTNAPPAMFLIDPGVTGKTIKAIADVTISGTSGTGPANLIATKELGAISMNPTSPANYIERKGWEELGLAEVGPDAHLMAYIVPMSAISTTPVIDGTITIGGA